MYGYPCYGPGYPGYYGGGGYLFALGVILLILLFLFYTYHTRVHPRLRSTAAAPIDQQQQVV